MGWHLGPNNVPAILKDKNKTEKKPDTLNVRTTFVDLTNALIIIKVARIFIEVCKKKIFRRRVTITLYHQILLPFRSLK